MKASTLAVQDQLLAVLRDVCTACGLVLDRDHNAALNLAALAADTDELRREQPEGTDVRRARRAGCAVGLPREEPCTAQRHRRKAMAR